MRRNRVVPTGVFRASQRKTPASGKPGPDARDGSATAGPLALASDDGLSGTAPFGAYISGATSWVFPETRDVVVRRGPCGGFSGFQRPAPATEPRHGAVNRQGHRPVPDESVRSSLASTGLRALEASGVSSRGTWRRPRPILPAPRPTSFHFNAVCTSTSATPPRSTSATARWKTPARSVGSVTGPSPQTP